MLAAISGANAQETTGPIGEIIVTAQKREERLQDVPMAITAFNTEQLQELRIADFEDYVKFLPNVSYEQSGGPGFARIFMRGVTSGDNGNHSGPLPSVGMYLDEQPITTIQGPLDIHLYDIARVETLAGPQGTLYGASSQSGTIRIITNKPEIGEFSAAYDLSGSSVNKGELGYVAEGYVNVPLGERTALRLVGWYDHDAGYIDNVPGTRTYPTLDSVTDGNGTFDNASVVDDNINGVDTYGARASLRINLNDNWTVTPTVMGQHQESDGIFYYDPAVGDLEYTHYPPKEDTKDDWYQAALTVEGRIGDWTLTYAGAYLDRNDETRLDYSDYALAYDTYYFGSTTFPYGDYFFNDDGDIISPAEHIVGKDWYGKISQELRIASPADQRVRFIGGLFYQKQNHDIEQRYVIDDLATSAEVTGWPDTWWLTEQKREDIDKAVFGEVSFDITEKLSATAGLRYFKSENSLNGFFGFGLTNDFTSSTGEKSCFAPGGPNGAPCTNLDASVDDSDETHKINLTYRFDKDHLVYATYSTGYRPGGVNRNGDFPPYKPDFLDNYEIGWKTTWAGGTFLWNGAAFWEKWDDFQFSFLGANGLTNITNAGKADIYGVETEFQWAVTESLMLYGSAMWLKPELSSDFCELLTDSGNRVGDDEDDEPLSIADCQTFYPEKFAPDGTTLPTVPDFKANVVGRFAYTLGGLEGHLQSSVVYQTDSRPALLPADEALLGGKMGDYYIVDVSASVERESWTAELFVDNVFDERADLFRFAQCDEAICAANAGLGGSTYVATNQPRTIGLRFGQKFGGR